MRQNYFEMQNSFQNKFKNFPILQNIFFLKMRETIEFYLFEFIS